MASDPRRIRVHEAGHVVVALAQHIPVVSVSVQPVGNFMGLTRFDMPYGLNRLRRSTVLRRMIRVLYAGAAAERQVFGNHEQGCDADDLQRVAQLVSRLAATGADASLDHLHRLLDQTDEMLRQRPRQLRRLDRALEQTPVLDGATILRVIRRRNWPT